MYIVVSLQYHSIQAHLLWCLLLVRYNQSESILTDIDRFFSVYRWYIHNINYIFNPLTSSGIQDVDEVFIYDTTYIDRQAMKTFIGEH